MKFNTFEAVGIAVSVVAMVIVLYLIQRNPSPEPTALTEAPSASHTPIVVSESENDRAALADALVAGSNVTGEIERLIIDDVLVGEGEEALSGSTVSVHYIGTLQNGQMFDNSYDRGAPFSFTLGANRVIAGWEQGILGMREGGQRILVIPPALAYGERGSGPIPGGATLVFAVELVDVQ